MSFIRNSEIYGFVKPIIYARIKDKCFVALSVTSKVCPGDSWITFIDFLSDYIKMVLGKEWWQSQIQQCPDKRHQIVKWSYDVHKYFKKYETQINGVFEVPPNGIVAAYYHLAYDLFTLEHNSRLPKTLIDRLKDETQFQGVKYELFVASTCCRAGFNIHYSDESDRTIKHPEFNAEHLSTGQMISVEAKSHHWPGVLGQDGEQFEYEELRLKVNKQLTNAFQKPTKYPYIVFIDLNCPPLRRDFSNDMVIKKLFDSIERSIHFERDKRDRYFMIIYTNHPFHYGDFNAPIPQSYFIHSVSANPNITPQNSNFIRDMVKALDIYKNIPVNFSDLE